MSDVKRLFMETTLINAERTVAEIHEMLAAHGASTILNEYEMCKVSAVAFKIPLGGKDIPFRLPCRWRNLETALRQAGRRPKSGLEFEEWARRVAWRQVYRWVQAQFALIDTDMVKVQEVFLPYAQAPNGETFFERIESGGFLLLEQKKA